MFRERVDARLVAELLGMAKGVIADGVVSDAEAVALQQWITRHPSVATQFPANVLAERLARVFDDGVIDEEERSDLRQLLLHITGESEDLTGTMDHAMRLGCTYPPPTILFDGREFCFTGRFAYGTRGACERAVTDRGGRTVASPTSRTAYVVVGTYGSDAWLQSTFGTKMERAHELRAAGHTLHLITEPHWVEAVRYDE